MDIELGEDFEFDGFWWIPEKENDRKAGKLTSRSTEGIQLHLRGDFSREDVRLPIIQGRTYDGSQCTLIDNYFMGPAIGSMDLDAPHFFGTTYLILGASFDSDAAVISPSMSVNFTLLGEWLGFSPLDAGYPVDRIVGDDWGDLQIFFDRPTEIKVNIPKIHATLSTDYALQTEYGRYQPARQIYTPYLTIVPDEPKHYSWFQDKIWDLERFFTLMSGKPVRAKRVRCQLTARKNISKWDFLISHAIKGELHIVHPSILLIRKKQITNFEEVVNTWFDVYERLSTVVDLFLGVSYNSKQYRTSDFLNLTQALEAYHRKMDQDRYVNPEKYEGIYEALVKNIPENTPRGLRDSLKAKLKYGNEYSLRSRLKRTLRSLPQTAQQLVTHNFGNFVETVVDSRNYYTHYDDSLKEKAVTDYGVLGMNKRLSALIMFILYQELHIEYDVQLGAASKYLDPPYFYDPLSDD